MSYNYVIYHGGCLDGFTSFIILHNSKLIKKDALIYHDQPHSKSVPPNIKGKDIIIMDVAYKKEILQQIFNLAKSVVFIDHHDSISLDVQNLHNIKNHTIIYDEKESGASLTWKFIHKKKKIPLFIKYIKDNDIGAWKFKNTESFIIALRVHYSTKLTDHNVKAWKKLITNTQEVYSLIKKGNQYKVYYDHLLEENLKKYSLMQFPGEKIMHLFPNMKLGQYRVAVYNGSGCPNSSILGREFASRINCDFAIIWTYNIDRNEYVLQFRSSEVDVGEIAKAFGGGGHILASAGSFSANKYNIKDLFLPEALPRN